LIAKSLSIPFTGLMFSSGLSNTSFKFDAGQCLQHNFTWVSHFYSCCTTSDVLPTPPLPVKNKYLVVESVIFVLSDVKVFRINVSSFRVRHNGL
jgi:hypothetical protein